MDNVFLQKQTQWGRMLLLAIFLSLLALHFFFGSFYSPTSPVFFFSFLFSPFGILFSFFLEYILLFFISFFVGKRLFVFRPRLWSIISFSLFSVILGLILFGFLALVPAYKNMKAEKLAAKIGADFNEAVTRNDPEKCKQIPVQGMYVDRIGLPGARITSSGYRGCLTELALKNKDVSLCKLLPDEFHPFVVKIEYDEECVRVLARQEQDPALCDLTRIYKDWCLSEAGGSSFDFDSGGPLRFVGIVPLGSHPQYHNLSECDSLPSTHVFSCIVDVASSQQDLSICNKIPTLVEGAPAFSSREDCVKALGAILPDAKLDISACDFISSGREYYRCAFTMIKNFSNASWCDVLKEKNDFSDLRGTEWIDDMRGECRKAIQDPGRADSFIWS